MDTRGCGTPHDGVSSLSVGVCKGPGPYHDAGEQAHTLPAVGVGHHVTVANGEEGDGDKPHGSQEVAGHFLLIVIPGESREGWSAHTGPSAFITSPGAVPYCRELVTLEVQSDKGMVVEGMLSSRGRGHPHPPPSLPSTLMPSPHPQAAAWDICHPGPGHGAERCPGEGASICVHACATIPRPKTDIDRHGHGWPRVPEAAGSGGKDLGQKP